MSETIPSTELNFFQRTSEATGTVLAPANVIDAGAFGLGMYGIPRLDTWAGIIAAGTSYALDMVDGKVARATGTASKLGEAVDAAGDKVKLAYGIYHISRLKAAPAWMLAGSAVVNGVNAAITLTDQKVNHATPVVHPSKLGKRAIALQEFGIGINTVASKLERDNVLPRVQKALKLSGNVLGAAGIGMGAAASLGYASKLGVSMRPKLT